MLVGGLFSLYVKRLGEERWTPVVENKKNLLTNGGRDWMHAQVYTNTSAGTAASNWVAVTQTAITPAAGDTTLSGEITTGGLARAQATPAHTAGTNSTTLTITYTASTSFSTVQGSGLFNASSAGTESHESTFTSTALNSGDQLQVVWTVNLG